uniref:Ig-like domain-containing protein n=2 Tax=Salarias fasciatus TaxID=181472 RepID=A0A672JFF7_SALFA
MKPTVGSSRLSAPGAVTGAYGGSVTVSCRYSPRFKDNTKYWCRGPVYELCTIVTKTSWGQPNDRTSIVDDKESEVFTVTVTSLQESDKDMYWCVISRPGRNVYAGVRLHLSHAATTVTTTHINSLPTLEQDQIGWWMILRWIVFISMLCCLALAHIAERRIKAAREMQLQQQLDRKSLNNYEIMSSDATVTDL